MTKCITSDGDNSALNSFSAGNACRMSSVPGSILKCICVKPCCMCNVLSCSVCSALYLFMRTRLMVIGSPFHSAPVAPLVQFILLNGSNENTKKANIWFRYCILSVLVRACICVSGDIWSILCIIYVVFMCCGKNEPDAGWLSSFLPTNSWPLTRKIRINSNWILANSYVKQMRYH